ncbi:hypothetical protein GHT09_005234 [Marmota monax]|uniref:Uncharacterized protein n=1 Tax=Marmota monax TaxID=9995 RepID=A0A834PRB0_MARMO|nr:hypothetical protein GHT09_005234 [Marmota monax]
MSPNSFIKLQTNRYVSRLLFAAGLGAAPPCPSGRPGGLLGTGPGLGSRCPSLASSGAARLPQPRNISHSRGKLGEPPKKGATRPSQGSSKSRWPPDLGEPRPRPPGRLAAEERAQDTTGRPLAQCLLTLSVTPRRVQADETEAREEAEEALDHLGPVPTWILSPPGSCPRPSPAPAPHSAPHQAA